MSAARSGPTPVVGRVLKLANEVHGLARSAERADVVEAVADQASRWTDSAATVVVAGAQKRGKSRLVNALVGRPGLIPVDADVPTHTQVTLRHGDTLRVVVHRTGADGPLPTDESGIDPSQLAAYVSGTVEPQVLREVTGVEVALDETLLDGLRLVDTPGIDSLTLGHRHTTTAALRRADALLFAVSAQDQPILRHELEFLAEAAARVPTIAFVLTKVDDSVSAGALLDENRTRLARFLEDADLDPAVGQRLREAPWLPVSALLGEASARSASANPDRARARMERSGLQALRAHLRGVADRRELVRATGVLAVTTAGLRALAAVEQDRIAGAADDDGLRDRRDTIEAELAGLAALRRERRRHALDHQLLGRGITGRARARSDGYRRTYEREIAELTTPAAVARYADELAGSLDRTLAAAWDETVVDIEQTVRRALGRYLAEMGADPTALGGVNAATPQRPGSDLRAAAPVPAFDIVGEGLPAAMMAGGAGFMAYNALGLAALGIPLIAPLALGGLLAGTLVAHRRRVAAAARNRAALTKALGDALAVATTEMCLAAEHAVAAWRANAEDAVDLALSARQKELDGRRRELEAAKARDAADRRRTAAEATERLQAIDTCLDRAEALRLDLAAVLRSTAAPDEVG